MARYPKKEKITGRARSKYRVRKKISGTEQRPRLSVCRSGRHTYAQVISDVSGQTLASASTLEKEVIAAMDGVSTEGVHSECRSTKSTLAAKAVGSIVGQRCKEKNIDEVVFDRNGLFYHGRVQAVADGARESGLQF